MEVKTDGIALRITAELSQLAENLRLTENDLV